MQLLKSKYAAIILLISFAIVVFACLNVLVSGNEGGFIDTNLYLTYVLVAVLVVLVIGFSVKQIMGNKKSLITMGIGIGALLAIFGGSYSSASSSLEGLNLTVAATSGDVQFVGAITTTTIILIGIGVGVLLFFEVRKMITNG